MPAMSTILAVLALVISVVVAGALVAERRRSGALRRRLQRLTLRVANGESVTRALFEARVRRDMAEKGLSPRFAVRFRSQHAEDMFLYELFEGRGEGFFIEVGAYDGFSFAVTYALEAIGWRGLLVEPIPERAEMARRARPASRVVNAALARRGSTGTTTLTRFVDESSQDELSSFVEAVGGEVPRPGSRAERVEVPLTTMDALLEGHEGPIDLAVIDIEGGELNLLDGFDLGRNGPRAILIEDHARAEGSPIGRYLRERGYEDAAWFAFNRLMIRRDEPALLLRARSIAYSTDSARKPPESPPDNLGGA